jgi:hypothetical protein
MIPLNTFSVKLSAKLDDPSKPVQIYRKTTTALAPHSLNNLTPIKTSSTPFRLNSSTIFQKVLSHRITQSASSSIYRALAPPPTRVLFCRLVRSLWFATHSVDVPLPTDLANNEWKSITRDGTSNVITTTKFHRWWVSSVISWGGGLDHAEDVDMLGRGGGTRITPSSPPSPVILLERLLRYFEMLTEELIDDHEMNTSIQLKHLSDIVKSKTDKNNIVSSTFSHFNAGSISRVDNEKDFVKQSSRPPSRVFTAPSGAKRKNKIHDVVSNIDNNESKMVVHLNVLSFSRNEQQQEQHEQHEQQHNNKLENGEEKTKSMYQSPPNPHLMRLLERQKNGVNCRRPATSEGRTPTKGGSVCGGQFDQQNGIQILNVRPSATKLSRQQHQKLNILSRRRPSFSETLQKMDSTLYNYCSSDSLDSSYQPWEPAEEKMEEAGNRMIYDNNYNRNTQLSDYSGRSTKRKTSPIRGNNSRKINSSVQTKYEASHSMPNLVNLKAPQYHAKMMESRKIYSPLTPFREGKQLQFLQPKPIYPCEEYWIEPKNKVMVARIQNGAKSVVHTLVDSPLLQPNSRLNHSNDIDSFTSAEIPQSRVQSTYYRNTNTKKTGKRTIKNNKSIYQVDSMSDLNHVMKLHNISSNPRDINYWSEVSALRKRREKHVQKMNKILSAQERKKNKSIDEKLKYQEANILKQVEILEADARDVLGKEEYSQIRHRLANPRKDPSVAEILSGTTGVVGSIGGSLDSGESSLIHVGDLNHQDPRFMLLEATKKSEQKSEAMLKKNQRLRRRLYEMLK